MELVLLWYKTWCRVGLVIQSLLLSTTQQPPNKPLISPTQTCQCSTAVPSNLPVGWTPSLGLLQGGLEVTTCQVNRYVETNLVFFWWRLICFDLDPWHGFHRPPLDPGVQDLGDGRLSLGANPLQPWRTREAQGSGANQSSPTILVENHQDGGDQSRSRQKGNGRLYQLYEALFGDRDETVEDVEGGRKPSEFPVVFSWINSSSNIFLIGWLSWRPDEGHAEDPGGDGLPPGAERWGASTAPLSVSGRWGSTGCPLPADAGAHLLSGIKGRGSSKGPWGDQWVVWLSQGWDQLP